MALTASTLGGFALEPGDLIYSAKWGDCLYVEPIRADVLGSEGDDRFGVVRAIVEDMGALLLSTLDLGVLVHSA